MSPKETLLCLSLFLLVSFSTPSASVSDELTVYEVLEEYDFPVGILPKGYKSTITGVITDDKISSLSGIKVKVLFLWLSIVKVIRDDDELEFSVGIGSADFPVSNFVESPTCGCGFDCVNGKGSKIKINNLVSWA
ncbi:uncharacterized protein Pyn_28722 [Prunus yedoensis var. nudiflora]|uniref:Uncharacterized protein n=1 Tax=Prunus yedoensis var. nudiflora TaxID=2094558 RepID=A0A314Y6L9_PRUYE|nr:uncharacterized protein Pyn_28722 [Prunus yedoensis var. nudiflora]